MIPIWFGGLSQYPVKPDATIIYERVEALLVHPSDSAGPSASVRSCFFERAFIPTVKVRFLIAEKVRHRKKTAEQGVDGRRRSADGRCVPRSLVAGRATAAVAAPPPTSCGMSDRRGAKLPMGRAREDAKPDGPHRLVAFPPVRLGSWHRLRSVSQEFDELELRPGPSSIAHTPAVRLLCVAVRRRCVLTSHVNRDRLGWLELPRGHQAGANPRPAAGKENAQDQDRLRHRPVVQFCGDAGCV